MRLYYTNKNNKEIIKLKRKYQKEELKQIEAKLHPAPKVGETEILHKHKKRINTPK